MWPRTWVSTYQGVLNQGAVVAVALLERVHQCDGVHDNHRLQAIFAPKKAGRVMAAQIPPRGICQTSSPLLGAIQDDGASGCEPEMAA